MFESNSAPFSEGSRWAGKVVAATVTYAARGTLCARVVRAALNAGADTVIVVDNGATVESRSVLQALAQEDSRILLLEARKNRGSAVGFGEALVAASSVGEFTWLLDDDNVPRADALEALKTAYLQTPGDCDPILFSYRETDSMQRALVNRGRPLPAAGSFLYVDALSRLRRNRKRKERQVPGDFSLPYGPYGGLFGRGRLLCGVDPPDAGMYLYEDDTEYTRRLALAGHPLILVTNSQVDDIDSKWSEEGSVGGPMRYLVASDDRRMQLAVRNRVYVERLWADNVRMKYYLNKLIFFLVMAPMIPQYWPVFKIFHQAVIDGERMAAIKLRNGGSGEK